MKKILLPVLIALVSLSTTQVAIAAKKGGTCYSMNNGEQYTCSFISANKRFSVEDLYDSGYRVVAYRGPIPTSPAHMIIVEQQ
ncbi:MAG: hypothetical protein L0G39_21110 [Chryseobacterium sp.]|nr:hypothetical protein [Chryseobacterium sp.]